MWNSAVKKWQYKGGDQTVYADPASKLDSQYVRMLILYKNSGIILLYQGGDIMPTIKSSADLRNNYNEISKFCHNYTEPVFITKNGKGDLAVMSIEAYEMLTSRFELYEQIKIGLDDIANGNTKPFNEAMANIRSRRKR